MAVAQSDWTVVPSRGGAAAGAEEPNANGRKAEERREEDEKVLGSTFPKRRSELNLTLSASRRPGGTRTASTAVQIPFD